MYYFIIQIYKKYFACKRVYTTIMDGYELFNIYKRIYTTRNTEHSPLSHCCLMSIKEHVQQDNV